MKTVACFIGSRPEAIKMAPVVAAMRAADRLRPLVVATGQHRELLRQALDACAVTVDHDLAVMEREQTLAGLTARLMTRIDAVLEEVRPDCALVQGDTTTMLVAALACFYRRIPVAHLEAGLRTGDVDSPFPEEANRKLATPLIALHLAPTQRARANLLAEGVAEARVVVTGNTAVDALHLELARQRQGAVARHIEETLSCELGEGWDAQPFVLVTAHRRESIGEGLEGICDALAQLAARLGSHRFVFPMHPNPQVCGPIRARLGGHANIDLVGPMDYGCFVALMRRCRLIVTDSGGVQEEAPTLGKPVVILRDTTERTEAIEAGIARLVGTNPARIVETVAELLIDENAYLSMIPTVNPFGDGEAAARIVAAIDRLLVTEA